MLRPQNLFSHLTPGLKPLGQNLKEPSLENLTSLSEQASKTQTSGVSPYTVPARSLYREAHSGKPTHRHEALINYLMSPIT